MPLFAMEKDEKGSDSNLSSRIEADLFEGTVDQTEDVKHPEETIPTPTPEPAGPPKSLEVPEYVFFTLCLGTS